MRFATYSAGSGEDRLGVLAGVPGKEGWIVDLARCQQLRGGEGAALTSMLAFIRAGEPALDIARETVSRDVPPEALHALDEVLLKAPLPVPEQIRDFSVFERHIRDAPRGSARLRARLGIAAEATAPVAPAADIHPVYRERPIYYHSNRFNVVGPDVDIEWPAYSGYIDFELEIGMITRGSGRDIAPAEADGHIFGYTLFNDFSVREIQSREMAGRLGPTKGKSFDTGNAIGPWIVTPDEMPDIRSLTATVRVNGETWVTSSTADMLHDFVDMLAYVSRSETIYPGELFGSGTVGGCCGLELDRWLQVGDLVELEVAPLGILRNRVVRSRQV